MITFIGNSNKYIVINFYLILIYKTNVFTLNYITFVKFNNFYSLYTYIISCFIFTCIYNYLII